MKDLNQLLLNFNYKKNFNYDNFYVSKSNFYAFEILEKWPKWEKNILNVHGEKFSGKSHLANIFCKKKNSKKIDEKQLNDEILKELKLFEIIILDNFENISDERIIYALFNLVDNDNKYLVINSLSPINEIKFKLNDLNSRSKNCLFAKIDSPDDDLIFAIILKNLSDRQITIDKKLIDFIIKIELDSSYGKITLLASNSSSLSLLV